tara:strand:- start:1122 stop:1562 length:441 start_codon:yes stop_codon:yes gene_type:complete
MIIVDFKSDHAKEILCGSVNDEKIRPAIEISQFVETMVVKNLAFTGVQDGKIIACGGIYPIWNGVGDAWFLGTNMIFDHPLKVTKIVKKYLIELMNLNNFHRVQAYVRHDWENAQRWIEVLGMQVEGTARKYSTDGRDHILFSRVI